MFEPFVQKAFDKMKDAGLAPVYLEQVNLLEQHIAFLSDKLAHAEKDLAKAENKLEEANKELVELRSRLASFDGRAQLLEIGPCLIKTASSGQRLEGVYCPHCHSYMEKGKYKPFSDDYVYLCSKCDFMLSSKVVESALESFPV